MSTRGGCLQIAYTIPTFWAPATNTIWNRVATFVLRSFCVRLSEPRLYGMLWLPVGKKWSPCTIQKRRAPGKTAHRHPGVRDVAGAGLPVRGQDTLGAPHGDAGDVLFPGAVAVLLATAVGWLVSRRLTAYLERAQGQVARLERLADELLQLSRIEAGANGGDRRPVDLAALVRELAEAQAARADQVGGRRYQSRTPASAFPWKTCHNSSAVSTAAATQPGIRAAAWVWRSSKLWPSTTAVVCRPKTPATVHASQCACRWPDPSRSIPTSGGQAGSITVIVVSWQTGLSAEIVPPCFVTIPPHDCQPWPGSVADCSAPPIQISEAAGGEVVADTCAVAAPMQMPGVRFMATNAGKMACYAPMHSGVWIRFRDLEQCLDAAMMGEWRGRMAN